MQITTRAEAKQSGLTRYFTGSPCLRGHVAPRNTKGGYCTECWNLLYQPHRRRDSDTEAAHKGWRGARARGAIMPPGYSWRDAIPIYAEARRRTLETGTPHDVDHIVPCCQGGHHAPYNLRVITAEENRNRPYKARA